LKSLFLDHAVFLLFQTLTKLALRAARPIRRHNKWYADGFEVMLADSPNESRLSVADPVAIVSMLTLFGDLLNCAVNPGG
jgi:hypothetical protein